MNDTQNNYIRCEILLATTVNYISNAWQRLPDHQLRSAYVCIKAYTELIIGYTVRVTVIIPLSPSTMYLPYI